MKVFTKTLFAVLSISTIIAYSSSYAEVLVAANTGRHTEYDTSERVINVEMVAMQQVIMNNRLGARITQGQIYALARDVVPKSLGYDENQKDLNQKFTIDDLQVDQVRLRDYKRPRPVTLRANVGDTLQITLKNLLPESADESLSYAGLQIAGLEWLNREGEESTNGIRIAPGEKHTYLYKATGEGVYIMFSPNGKSIPGSQLDYGLFGAVNVQPQHAEYYRSQVTHEDLQLASYRVSEKFFEKWVGSDDPELCNQYLDSTQTGLPASVGLKRKLVNIGNRLVCPKASEDVLWQLRLPSKQRDKTAMVSSIRIDNNRYLKTETNQPVIDYTAMYPPEHVRSGSPVLNMLAFNSKSGAYQLVHSDLTGIITGPEAGRFPYYINSPSFIENPATPDRRQPYREFTIAYHISPNTAQAFEAFNKGPLKNTLAAGFDGFAVNYGIAGIAPEIFANRINVGPQGINKDGVDLLFEEFFLSAWAVGDPAILVDIPANFNKRATRALYPDDPSNVYHSYMRDHVKFRVMNAGSVAPHVHHQHAHQWLHTPNSADSHYLDSQMINPGSSYTLEMTYNGSGNRNQTVGDSIFHCHIYPHFAQGMWGMWRVHDVFEAGTQLDAAGRPLPGSRALPDGEITAGTPIPALVPLPTLAMAPQPARAYLIDNGRRTQVEQDSVDEAGNPVFQNPGFPFFIPGVAGHRAPHPPMDFAWKENPDNTPKRLSAAEAAEDPIKKEGDIDYLDGGLPRNVVLDGTIEREFHSRWDFTKTVGQMKALMLPENGTAVEQAAMAAHATRTHESHLPNGLPGNFILNGLPPSPGAPFAAPEVNDDGNSTFNKRRYKAAVIQTDVVFNKQGWHYPQQRFITLLDDVKSTIEGERPPEPFFFRSETGETVEFWHTNLVPNYYELDDFQVRTPTDILGQHIHLVKFDVTSSDGAGNGFNYEDGTFSPAEVQERIESINKAGGIYLFDSQTQFSSDEQATLKLSSYIEDYGVALGKPPAGQDWNGAQTTIQRFGTDPLLNHQGEDRTLRTVFTHDHFGPSTHQQVGLYGAMLVEPSGTEWFDAVTGKQFPDLQRDDGGPTSWQALIEGYDSEASFREFAIAMGDLQLAYTGESTSTRKIPGSIWFSTPNMDYESDLNNGVIPQKLSSVFTDQGAILAEDATVKKDADVSSQWRLSPNGHDEFILRLEGGELMVRTLTISASWADFDEAIWPPTAAQLASSGQAVGANNPVDSNFAPFPTIISDPGGSGNIGIWVSNYRNEPADARLQGDAGTDTSATDPSYAFASIERDNPILNSQPGPGAPIGSDPDGFSFPKKSLLPRSATGVQGTDPYTPLLRAYENDTVQVRAIVGAVDSVHSFGLQGVNWHAEPSYTDSGFRDTQGMGISEHFEMLFSLPPVTGGNGSVVDRLYSPSTSSLGLNKGAWGVQRTYSSRVPDLAALKHNDPDKPGINGFYDLPEGKQADRIFNITVDVAPGASAANQASQLHYTVNGKKLDYLVLRAAAGEWIEINLTNNLKAAQVKDLGTRWSAEQLSANNTSLSQMASSDAIDSFTGSSVIGLNPRLISYDAGKDAGLNIGINSTSQTVPIGETKSYLWYAGTIEIDESEENRRLSPVEYGAVNLTPSDLLLQSSYGLSGVLIVEPEGSRWDPQQAHELTAVIEDAQSIPLFTEIIVAGTTTASATVTAGSQVRFRVINPNLQPAGEVGDSTHVLLIEGHNWPEEPYVNDSSVIGNNTLTQTMGTQQITTYESYNMVIKSAGGESRAAGDYDYYYYPKGPSPKGQASTILGTLTVKPES